MTESTPTKIIAYSKIIANASLLTDSDIEKYSRLFTNSNSKLIFQYFI